MAITVYSQKFKREIDIEQLLSLLGHNSLVDINTKIKNLSKHEKDEIYQDVLCPICLSRGGKIVLESITKQAHFRFDTHNYFCDYNNSKQDKSQKGKLVDFGTNRSGETKIIRELVAKGIEQKIISQQMISEMRKYFYETKVNYQYKMDVSIDALKWFYLLKSFKRRTLKIPDIKFNPLHAQLPEFNWNIAAEIFFINENKNLIEIANNCSLELENTQKLYDKTKKIIENTQGSRVFDVKELEIPYKNTIKLSQFIAFNLAIYTIDNGYPVYLDNSDIVLAFAALLLYISQWNIDLAILKLIEIVKSPEPIDINSGNIIGLNPFYNFEVWANISKIREVAKNSKNGFDLKAQIEAIKEQLRNEHRTNI
ncbi:hypothetical protein VB638_19430 [Dolichospermum sp. UHCC 0684]|uniref:hypothetical protein n=1 Tax=unclassified Dolichospermum TaxID=2622029 RepID=UPI00144525F9|nr:MULTISPECIES: hypothetical protein [unclassified Dolichospermum]MEA5531713.1 hypothetical protein [Dolichospermum sp. UHCC 0684]MTJ33313.1 hypothetical protein [Dolichospermum sp. UHCC 0260]